MKAIEFKGVNVVFAEDQPEYLPLPAMILPDGNAYTCWELDEQDIKAIAKNGGKIYVCQSTFNKPLQPINVMTDLSDNFDLEN